MKVTYYGQACLEVELQGKKVLFDPFISGNEKAKDIDVNSLKPDFILLTHGHADHCADALTIAQNSHAKIISGYEAVSWFQGQGIENVHPMNHGGKWTFDFGTVKMTNAIHSNSMPDGSYGGHPGGFVVTSEEGTFYHAGDTALMMDMQLIPMTSPSLNWAALPIGDNFTMGYEDAAVAADFIKCSKILGIHYDTFGFIEIDHDKAKKCFADKGHELILVDIGEQVEL